MKAVSITLRAKKLPLAGLDPAIHVFRSAGNEKTGVRGSSPRKGVIVGLRLGTP